MTDPAGVGDVRDGGDHERRWHRVALAVDADVLVVQRVLAGDERRAVRPGCGAAPLDGGDELAEGRLAARIAPREVVEQRDPVGIGAGGDHVADRLVDGRVRHPLGVVAARYHGLTPMPIAMPCVSAGSASTTPSLGPSAWTPVIGRTTVEPRISWSYRWMIEALEAMLRWARSARSAAVAIGDVGGCRG